MRELAALPNVYRGRRFFHEDAIDALEGPGCIPCRYANPVHWGGLPCSKWPFHNV
jgi:hypothetical protein